MSRPLPPLPLSADSDLPELVCKRCAWMFHPSMLVGNAPLTRYAGPGHCPSHLDWDRRPAAPSISPRNTYVYVVRLSDDARQKVLRSMRKEDRARVQERKRCLYVGYSENPPKVRYDIERSGGKTAVKVVGQFGQGLWLGLYEYLNTPEKRTPENGLAMEAWLAEHLRRQGYGVYGQAHGIQRWSRQAGLAGGARSPS
jgi:hypothetical protein